MLRALGSALARAPRRTHDLWQLDMEIEETRPNGGWRWGPARGHGQEGKRDGARMRSVPPSSRERRSASASSAVQREGR
jgi:hypothetical protein